MTEVTKPGADDPMAQMDTSVDKDNTVVDIIDEEKWNKLTANYDSAYSDMTMNRSSQNIEGLAEFASSIKQLSEEKFNQIGPEKTQNEIVIASLKDQLSTNLKREDSGKWISAIKLMSLIKNLSHEDVYQLTDSDWSQLNEIAEASKQKEQPYDFLQLAMSLKSLDPEQFNRLNLSEEIWVKLLDNIKQGFQKQSSNNWFLGQSWLLKAAKTLFPDRSAEIPEDIEFSNGMKNYLKTSKPDASYAVYAVNAKIINGK